MAFAPQRGRRYRLRLGWTEFQLPPVRDGIVVGRRSPVGPVALYKAIELLSFQSFRHIDVDDDVVAAILVREAVTRRVSEEILVQLVLEEIKPSMSGDEVLRVDIEHEMEVEERGP